MKMPFKSRKPKTPTAKQHRKIDFKLPRIKSKRSILTFDAITLHQPQESPNACLTLDTYRFGLILTFLCSHLRISKPNLDCCLDCDSDPPPPPNHHVV